MKQDVKDIMIVAEFVKEAQLKYGNPAGISPKELASWSKGLGLKERGPTIFYSGMYNYMGYAESALIIEYLVKSNGLSFSTLLDMLNKVRWLGHERNLKGLFEIARSPLMRFGSLLNVPPELVNKIKIVASEAEKRNEVYKNILAKSALILKKSGIDFAYLSENEPDTGIALHTFGLLREFEEYANGVYKKLKDYGVKEIITPDPISGTVFRSFYPRFVDGFDIEVKHITEVLSPNSSNGKRGDVVFHDPCYLARYWKITEKPRELLKGAGYNVIDPPNNRERTRCDGGATEFQDPVGSVTSAQIRLKELLSTGTNSVVTSCPACVMLLRVGNYFFGSDARVYDITELLGD